jgi:hypothetical protein
VALIPKVRVRIVMSVKPGLSIIERKAKRRSRQRLSHLKG